ncbi:GAF and ANTAR domain-containing protein [Arthrobacter echini]|uniref:GAF and ANTAR domain-containing protein n=1 Tax=Arthrobacter echini TaxID=1529066 RepID=A0A5D0XUC7_9MICC|nr:GAF and ANTAR domain-containing protein [Arthrobacter echini]TYD00286.1 GAF and ANTAR domain-containing protein [Arthrobacter echini]
MNNPLTSASPPRPAPDLAATLQTLVLDSTAVRDFMDRLAHLIAQRLTTVDRTVLCGITLIRPRSAVTVASSSERAQVMDEIQYSFGDGPCLDAARHRTTNHVPDVLDEGQRWPEYRAEIAHHGLRSILAVPIALPAADTDNEVEADRSAHADKATGCAINLYADNPHAFSAADIDEALDIARTVTTTLAIAVRLAGTSDRAEQLEAAMTSRTVIDLAAGIIMAQNRCSQDSAMTILKAASSARNLKVRDLAATVIASVSAEPALTHFDG